MDIFVRKSGGMNIDILFYGASGLEISKNNFSSSSKIKLLFNNNNNSNDTMV